MSVRKGAHFLNKKLELNKKHYLCTVLFTQI